MKLLRTIRLDPSDAFVFPRAAEAGEWAVTGTFLFAGRNIAALAGKERVAFRSGFLGIDSFGFSTLVVAQPIREDEQAAAVERLARHLVERMGAPSIDVARAAAGEEIAFSAALADHDEGTLVALHRLFEDGAIREQFRTLRRREAAAGADSLHAGARAFTFHETVGEDEPEERVDLIGLMDDRR